MRLAIKSDTAVIINTEKKIVAVDGATYPFKDGMTGASSAIIEGVVFVDGYELITGGDWKRTMRALRHLHL